ncbi:DUF2267 domain-containing protein [Amycolatopsis mongoliensis]|uniref:DUF2267 domain-containing protein n=1 Tax=Amycolatopsis mongoliensis TaxID=715475 RepID=A0A9Y2NA51_9PSEU|nr:DUF2267 domain-containing protein [Amycolatopsis sp. 4-36]WIX98245.1 DUF2267 domain-containing protein [Amycolatopsis sp. 4-36]
MSPHRDPLAHAQQRAHEWLTAVAAQLGTEDRHFAYRAVRAWLHLVRDRLTVDSAVHLGAQLPQFLRGVYYEGWAPAKVPVRYDADRFSALFAGEAQVGIAEVPAIAGAVSAAMNGLFSPGQLDHVFTVLPAGLRSELEGRPPVASAQPASHGTEHLRLNALEDTVLLLTDAVSALVRGLEELPTGEPGGGRAAKAAQEAHRILMSRDAVQT